MAAIDDPLVQQTLARTARLRRWKHLLALSMVAVTVTLFATAAYRQHAFNEHAIRTDATVVKVEQRATTSDYVITTVTVTWTPPGAAKAETLESDSNFVPKVGDLMKVRYDSRNPSNAFLNKNGGL